MTSEFAIPKTGDRFVAGRQELDTFCGPSMFDITERQSRTVQSLLMLATEIGCEIKISGSLDLETVCILVSLATMSGDNIAAVIAVDKTGEATVLRH